MKRPLVLFIIFYLAGIIFVSIFGMTISTIFISILFAICFLFIVNSESVWVICFCFMFFIAGTINFSYFNDKLNSFSKFTSKTINITATIVSEPEVKSNTTNYIIKTIIISDGSREYELSEKILLTLYLPGVNHYEPGQCINFTGNIEIPQERRNPGGFNYRNYLAQKKVYATAFVPAKNIKILGKKSVNPIYKSSLNVRNGIIESVNKKLSAQNAALLNGMLVGHKEDLSDEIKDIFSKTGLIHILSVSGLHVGFVVLPIVFISKKLRINRKLSNMITILILIFYCFIAGFTTSVIRAVTMVIVVLSAKIINRESDTITGIFFAGLLMLLYNPFFIYNVGFQLSFGATISIVMFNKKVKGIFKITGLPASITDVLAVSTAAQAGALPISVYYFNSLSIVSLFANVIILPLVQVAVLAGIAMIALAKICAFLSNIIGLIVDNLLSLIIILTDFISRLPYASIRVVTPSLLLIIFYYFLLIYFFNFKTVSEFIKPSGLAALVFYSIVLFQLLNPPVLEVVFLDVGEGDSVFIRTASRKNILIDGGGAGAEKLLPDFLLDYGVYSLDIVVATHSHADHITGLKPVLDEFNVRKLFLPVSEEIDNFKSLLSSVDSKKSTIYYAFNGVQIRLDEKTVLNVLSPDKNTNYKHSSLNNGSIVIKLEHVETSILFTADIEKETERLLSQNGLNLESDVLKIPHHGADTSSTEFFLSAVNPKVGIISVGKNNYGHPSENSIERICKQGISCMRTDYDGAIVIKSNGKNIRIKKTSDAALSYINAQE